jgi:DNA-binding NarL/FixJ family response regulator
VLADALHRLAEGECVIDPTIVSRLIARRERDRLTGLSQREREVLTLMAEGRSNRGISQKLSLSPKTVEAHVGSILLKLGLDGSPDAHRRVLAVLAFLRTAP